MSTAQSDGALVRTAIKLVPVVKFAIGIAAIAILISVIRAANADLGMGSMFAMIVVMLILMVLLIVVDKISESKSILTGPAVLVLWCSTIALVVMVAATVTATLFGWPVQLAELIIPAAADKPATPNQKPAIPAQAQPKTQTAAQPQVKLPKSVLSPVASELPAISERKGDAHKAPAQGVSPPNSLPTSEPETASAAGGLSKQQKDYCDLLSSLSATKQKLIAEVNNNPNDRDFIENQIRSIEIRLSPFKNDPRTSLCERF